MENMATKSSSSSFSVPQEQAVGEPPTCAICELKKVSLHLNYGGRSCIGCRAFFRRIIQNSRQNQLVCKSGTAHCRSTLKTRRRCKSCRFELCLEAGMKPQYVLSEAQIQLRFRRMIIKRKRLEAKPLNAATRSKKLASETIRSHVDQRDRQEGDPGVTSLVKLVDSEEPRAKPMLTTLTLQPTEYASSQNPCDVGPGISDVPLAQAYPAATDVTTNNLDNGTLDLNVGNRAALSLDNIARASSSENAAYSVSGCPQMTETFPMEYVKRVRQSWAEALHDFQPSQDFLRELGHLHRRTGIIREKTLQAHLNSVSNVFKHFATLQPEFQCLPRSDQEILLARNAPLFVQYILGRYLQASSVLEQINWIMLCHKETIEQLLDGLRYNSFAITAAEFNSSVKLFEDAPALQQYQNQARSLNQTILQYHCNCVIGLVCLFSTDTSTRLQDMSTVQRNLNFVFSVSDWAADKFNCATKQDLVAVVEALKGMLIIVQNQKRTRDKHSHRSPACREVTPRYSMDEEACVQEQLAHLDYSLEAIPLGEEVVHECIMYSLDVPLSKWFFPRNMALWAERYKLILKRTHALDHLRDRDQALAATNSTLNALALLVCKKESCKTGVEQLMISFGQNDWELVHKHLGLSMGSDCLRKVSMRDNAVLQLLDADALDRYMTIAEGLRDLVEDNEVYRILTLITIFCAAGIQERSTLGTMYINMARRKLMTIEGLQWERKFSRFKEALTDLHELASILKKIVALYQG